MLSFAAMTLGSPVCNHQGQYCCPDAKACLTPTDVRCDANATACTGNTVCCPLTKICVIPGAACDSPCTDPTTFCDAKGGVNNTFCVAPKTNTTCAGATDCTVVGDYCDPLIKMCVHNTTIPCTPPSGEPVCNGNEWCCPGQSSNGKTAPGQCLDAQKPHVSCLNAPDNCYASEGNYCDPLTQVCVHAYAACTSPCSDSTAYCSHDDKLCVKPTNPGVECGGWSHCAGGEEWCDPVTKLCVIAQEPCEPPTRPPGPIADFRTAK